MNSIKLRNGHYLGDEFTSVSFDVLYDKLVAYVKNHTSAFSNISGSKREGNVKIDYFSKDNYLDIIKSMSPDEFLKKNLIRTTRLKLKFVPERKCLEIVDDPDSNKLTYSVTCNNRINVKDSIYFDDEAVQDYSNDYDCEKYIDCKYTIARVSYDVKMSMMNTVTNDIENSEFSEAVYLCYNTETGKYESNAYEDTINKDESIDVKNLIKFLNSEQCNSIKTLTKDDGKFVRIYEFKNIRLSHTNFKMINKSEIGFMNFRSFASQLILKEFDKNLDRNSIIIGEEI